MCLALALGSAESDAASDISSLNYKNEYNYNNNYNASMKVLRFHDFEPRQQVARLFADGARDKEAGREARGFHFDATGDDVHVELEFIVPFVKIPVKRSINFARDAVKSVLNLQKGALLNTAVIVVAGAIIAGIVRLVLAPIVFTSMANNYAGYNAKEYDESVKSKNHISRGMRSVTQVLESQLDEHNIDVSVCAQRAICQYLQHNAAQLQRHEARLTSSNTARLINTLTNSRWTDSLLNGTAVFNAIDVARNSRNCNHIYRSCSWPQLQGGGFQRSWPSVLQYFNGPIHDSRRLGGRMKHLSLIKLILIQIGYVGILAAGVEESTTDSRSFSASARQINSNPGFKLISFDAVDKDISVGLDYLLPFVKVPVKRKRNENKPLLIVNSAAIFSCGLVAAAGLLAGHLIRSVGLETIIPDAKSEEPAKHTARSLHDEEQSFLQIFDNFKLVYRNASGERMETGLPSLMNTIESSFLDKDIDLNSCLLKSICTFTHKSIKNVRSGQASDLELMLDGVSSWSWMLSWLEQSALRKAIEAGRVTASHYCNAKYPRCKWTEPDEQLLDLLHNNVQFN
ncbi:uncharacterized protein LOC117792516 [Drosophila innubila]|uniref:uncharacterized protein LOC117792516 n=1 Tax=Drosophila innubila TaxID=198719 RepID=UPI00148E73A6|nr:uncharacterized protein LOC117792516 [Drosophila innubila]